MATLAGRTEPYVGARILILLSYCCCPHNDTPVRIASISSVGVCMAFSLFSNMQSCASLISVVVADGQVSMWATVSLADSQHGQASDLL